MSAGFDAHEDDPLAQMRMTTAGYAWVAARLTDLADAAACPLVAVTEGGYALSALASSLDVVCGQFEGARTATAMPTFRLATGRAATAIASLRAGGGVRWAGL